MSSYAGDGTLAAVVSVDSIWPIAGRRLRIDRFHFVSFSVDSPMQGLSSFAGMRLTLEDQSRCRLNISVLSRCQNHSRGMESPVQPCIGPCLVLWD